MRYFFAALLLMSASLIGADEIFKSNILGMKLEQISSENDAAGDYYLIRSEADGTINEKLYQKNIVFFNRNIVKKDGLTIIETESSGEFKKEEIKDGVIISEEIKRDGQQTERSDYIYDAGRLKSCTFYIDDNPVYLDRYYYSKEGRLLQVDREYEDERSSISSFSFSDGRLSTYSFTVDEQNIYIKFDKHGIVFSDAAGAGSQNETRKYGVLDNGNRFELINKSLSGETRRLLFNEDDRIISSIVKNADGRLLEETSWKYSGDLISEIRIRTLESIEAYSFAYADDGELQQKIYLKNGNIVQITEYQTKNEYTEKLYRHGEAVLEIKYKDGVRYLTEQLQE